MDKMAIVGGSRLQGEVDVSGAKNSALILLFSTLLAEGRHVFRNVPKLKDVESTELLLQSLGCETRWDGPLLIVDVKAQTNQEAHYDLVRKMRASILCLGPLLGRLGTAVVSLPGGCAIGTRPIDLHLEGMKALGAEVNLDQGYVHASAKKLKGAQIVFETVTVGGTENVMMAASLAEGTTYLENAAKEPEIVDLANYLNSMGAKISGAGTSVIKIEGVSRLKPQGEYSVMPDRIEAGTLIMAAAMTRGSVTIKKMVPEHLDFVLNKLKEVGIAVERGKDYVSMDVKQDWGAIDITTQPYPLFPTDLQAQWMALMSISTGTSVISETVFENRFMHVPELMRMGADISAKSRVAVVRGKPGCLKGAPVMATDLRASACLVMAGLAAEGETLVQRIYHLDRGYEKLEDKLSRLGAKVRRIKED